VSAGPHIEAAAPTPSSGPSDHLLPQGEKGASTHFAPSRPSTGSPSPLVGEGARRADEGAKERPNPRLQKLARSMRRQPTQAESRLWLLLRNRRFIEHKFRRQVPIGPYIADYACYSAKLIIEADGSQHAENERDAVRDAELNRRGFRILRIWNNDILARPDVVSEAIWQALQEPHHV
jgi:very-short-patch-repair endonuclease